MRLLPSVRTLRGAIALVTLASVAVGAAACASGGDDLLIFDATADLGLPPPPPDSGHDTGHVRDAGKDMGFEEFIGFGDASDGGGLDGSGDATFSVDVGPSFFGEPGTPCSPLHATQVEPCGKCGLATSTCIPAPDGGTPVTDAGHTGDGAADGGGMHDGGSMHDGSTLDGSPADGSTGDGATHDATINDSATKDASTGFVWGPFGACVGEIDAGCVPGSIQAVEACGFCGTQSIVCQPDCEYGSTACTGQGVCAPGTVDFVPVANCNDGGFGGTTSTCGATCTYGDAGACQVSPTTLTISPIALNTVDAASPPDTKVDTFVNFTTTLEKETVALTQGDPCPTMIGMPNEPVGFVTLKNSSATQTAIVSVWTSQVVSQPALDVGIASYPTQPTTNNELKNDCTPTIQDGPVPPGLFALGGICGDTSDPSACLGGYGGLMNADGNAVTIPPGGSVVIFVQNEFQEDCFIAGGDGGGGCVGLLGLGGAATGIIQLTARTEQFM